MKSNVAVVIPYYHSELTELEKISFQNCLDVLSSYPIVLVVSEKMPFTEYPSETDLIYEKVPAQWMESIDSYNHMMLSKDFYCRFIQYEYILIFQLDAFVFFDSLQKFCDLGYDYIGAPWLNGIKYLRTLENAIWYVGNGGFSLRKVSSFLNILEKTPINETNAHEDLIWASYCSEQFRVAPIEVALKFAFEQRVRDCFSLNHEELPFGCHAWEKYDFGFWRPIFEKMGYKVEGCTNEFSFQQEEITEPQYYYLEAGRPLVCSYINEISKSSDLSIYIFGAGEVGQECIWMMKHNNIPNVRCIDNNDNIWGRSIWGIIVESPDTIMKIKNDDNILIIIAVNNSKKEILFQLESCGFSYGSSIIYYSDIIEAIKSKMTKNAKGKNENENCDITFCL